ncbi:ADAM like decysin 1 [Ictidomys tridecemlineatus]|nr:ADAM like decysin 1 [Ictidomys tridecemlineatus]
MVIKQTPGIKLSEVVYPKLLHISHEGGMENNHTKRQGKEEIYAPEVQYQIILNGEEIILHLQKSRHLLGPDYTETYYSSAGEEITRRSQTMKHCYYEGHILNEKDSVASISTCDGLRSQYKMYRGNLTVMRSFLFDVMNLLNVIYKTVHVRVALVGMEIWSDSDKIKVVPNIGETFKNFMSWHRSNLGKRKIHDHAQLLSGIGFNNGRVGMAASNSLCSASSVAVIEAKRKNNVALVGVMSHELGHVLGMPDLSYTVKCPSGSCVMGQYLSSKFPKDFSSSCLSYFQKYLSSKKPKCIMQAPLPANIITEPVCGNQLLEVGEDCDCGSPKECKDRCCEASTCQLKLGPECGEEAPNPYT